MALFVFKGETNVLSARQLEFISNILEERGFKTETVNIETVGEAGDNFVANVKRIIVDKDGDIFKMIVKIAPVPEVQRETMNTVAVFQNEHVMYTKVLPKFTELEDELNIPESERLKFPVCYGSMMEEPNEIILLEDLCATNFIMFDKFKSLTYDTVKLVLRELAHFHSLSYVLKNRDPETFKVFSRQLKNFWGLMDNVEDAKLYMEQIESDVISTLEDDKFKKIVEGSLTKMIANTLENAKFYRETNCSAIQQGDVWTNNIMFRLEGETATQCCMIDYQMSNVNTPAADIQYMIFSCTDYETRSKYHNAWIDYYHMELENYLFKFGFRAQDFYTREQFDSDSKRQGKQLIGQLIMEATMLMREHNEAANLKAALENSNLDEMFNVSKLETMETTSLVRFKDKIEGFIRSFLELGYLE